MDGVNLSFNEGELTSIIGPNGAGKTTLFNLITGETLPDGGKIVFQGEDIAGLPPEQIVGKGIGRSFQITSLFASFSTYDNILMAALAREGSATKIFVDKEAMRRANDRTTEILEKVGLGKRSSLPVSNLSYGDQRLLEIGVALANNPMLLILDEFTAGISRRESKGMIAQLEKLSDEGITALLAEHDMDVVFSISERIVVMHQGKVIADGSPEEIRKKDVVKEAYLGGQA